MRRYTENLWYPASPNTSSRLAMLVSGMMFFRSALSETPLQNRCVAGVRTISRGKWRRLTAKHSWWRKIVGRHIKPSGVLREKLTPACDRALGFSSLFFLLLVIFWSGVQPWDWSAVWCREDGRAFICFFLMVVVRKLGLVAPWLHLRQELSQAPQLEHNSTYALET